MSYYDDLLAVIASSSIETVVSEGWDVSTATYASKSFYVGSQDSNPYGVFFKSDGLAMYILGYTNDTVYQYTLSTAWDVSTATYASKSFYVSSQDSNPRSVFFKSDGLAMYILGYTHYTVYQYTLSTAWDVSTATYAGKSFYVGSQDSTPHSVFFKSDGLAMYIMGNANDTVYQYTLSTAWDVSTATDASKYKSVGSQEDDPRSVFFKSDGLAMYIVGYAVNTVYQYTLSTAWDVSTATYASKSFYVGSQDSTPRSVFFKSDGLAMYIMGAAHVTVYQYTLS